MVSGWSMPYDHVLSLTPCFWQVTKNLQLWKGAKTAGADGQATFDKFNAELYHIIAANTLDVVQQGCSTVTDKCFNAARKEGELPISKRIDATYKIQGTDCLKLAVPTGKIDCKYWLSDGLGEDVAVAKGYANKAFRSAVRERAASWTVEGDMMPDLNLQHTREFKEVAYTLWVRFMGILTKSKTYSAVWAKPVTLPFYEDNAEYLSTFQGFNLASKLETESAIEKNGNSCEDTNPTVINYDRCSDEFTSLWVEAARSMQSHVRKQGPPVIPGRSALIWPGLTLAHHLADSIPAWSTYARNLSQVFGK